MKQRSSLVLTTLVVAGLALVAWPLRAEALVSQDAAGARVVSVHDAMEGLKMNLKAAATALQRDPGKPEIVRKHIVAMQRLVIDAKLGEPANIDEVPAEERAAHVIAFRRDMAKTLITLAEIEIELLEGRSDAAMQMIGGDLFNLRDASHKAYQKK